MIYNAETKGISVSVLPEYIQEESNPSIGRFIYSYKIIIENNGLYPIKLLTRHWYIQDSILVKKEVKGDGVIGQQPEIPVGGSFSYMSWCPLNSPVGKMYGTFLCKNLDDNTKIEVEVPEFLLVADFILN